MAKKKDEQRVEWPGREVDLMFWQYCVGLQHANIDVSRANNLAADRFKHLKTMFKKEPSFAVLFKAGEGMLQLEKKAIEQSQHA